MSKLRTLNRKVDEARLALDSAIDAVVIEVSKISGIENIQGNDLAGDGLGIRIDEDSNGDSHVGISQLIEVFEKTGTITRADLEKTSL